MIGLSDEIQNDVRMFKPQSLHEACYLAELQDVTLVSISRKTKPILERPVTSSRSTHNTFRTPYQSDQRPITRDYSSSSHSVTRPNYAHPATSTNSVSSRPRTTRRILSPKDIEEKWAKNLCFLCDEKYFHGHKCKAWVYKLEILEEEEEGTDEKDERVLNNDVGEVNLIGEEIPQISLHALNGLNAYQTMRVVGKTKNATLHILIDFGNTHNFLDIVVAKTLHCDVKKIPPVQLAITNGQ